MIPKGQNGYIESKNKNYIYRIGLCKQELLGQKIYFTYIKQWKWTDWISN